MATPVVTKYYYFGGQRVAMRQCDDSVCEDPVYLHSDHLGSASLATDNDGELISDIRYYPYGATRSGTVGTDYRYTGQRAEPIAGGIMDYRARYYDTRLQWIQPDTIVPDFSNPQSLNRYAYVLNNPLRYIDPTGHDPLDDQWYEEFRFVHGRDPTNDDILIRLFSIAFPGEWDWDNFYTPDGNLREGGMRSIFSNTSEGRDWASLPDAMQSMAGWYEINETEELVRDIGALFGGLLDRNEESNGWRAVRGGRAHNTTVWLGRAGLPEEYLGTDMTGNVHHWAWSLNLGYFRGRTIGQLANTIREWDSVGRSWHRLRTEANARADVTLGNIGASMGAFLSSPYTSPQSIKNAWSQMPLTVSVQ